MTQPPPEWKMRKGLWGALIPCNDRLWQVRRRHKQLPRFPEARCPVRISAQRVHRAERIQPSLLHWRWVEDGTPTCTKVHYRTPTSRLRVHPTFRDMGTWPCHCLGEYLPVYGRESVRRLLGEAKLERFHLSLFLLTAFLHGSLHLE
ncbi:unnamed protein product [Pleuronectes platessa]|uniref:Uncharacterized protein n=1 Tax=Pleuronectes platessa TaxID=8262 RepID=A0A9N7VCQ7_PLEPL|nr:unnamed protein product [Pleuronectes platessa]